MRMTIKDIALKKHIKNKRMTTIVTQMMMEEEKIENMDGISLGNKI